jgi:RHS repeat-associated protein
MRLRIADSQMSTMNWHSMKRASDYGSGSSASFLSIRLRILAGGDVHCSCQGNEAFEPLWDNDMPKLTTASNRLTNQHDLNPDGYHAGTRLRTANDTVLSYFLRDGNGSVRGLMGDNGLSNTAARLDYHAFGNKLAFGPNTAATKLLYSGHLRDNADGGYDNPFRAYDPTSERFTSLDDWQGNMEDPRSLHKYEYAEGEPTAYTDPSGHESILELAVAMADDMLLSSIMMAAIKPAAAYLAKALIPAGLFDTIKKLTPDALRLGVNLTGPLPGNLGFLNGTAGLEYVGGLSDDGHWHSAVFVPVSLGIGGTVSSWGGDFAKGLEKVPTLAGYVGLYWNLHNTQQIDGDPRLNVSISFKDLPPDVIWYFTKTIEMAAAQAEIDGAMKYASALRDEMSDLYASSIDLSFEWPIDTKPIGVAFDYAPQASYTAKRSSAVGIGTLFQISPRHGVTFQ